MPANVGRAGGWAATLAAGCPGAVTLAAGWASGEMVAASVVSGVVRGALASPGGAVVAVIVALGVTVSVGGAWAAL